MVCECSGPKHLCMYQEERNHPLMNEIMRALINGDDPGRIVERETLRAAVMRAIACPKSGAVLDVRTAVYYRVVNAEGKSGADVVTGEVWDVVAQGLTDHCEANGIALEVIDGRTL